MLRKSLVNDPLPYPMGPHGRVMSKPQAIPTLWMPPCGWHTCGPMGPGPRARAHGPWPMAGPPLVPTMAWTHGPGHPGPWARAHPGPWARAHGPMGPWHGKVMAWHGHGTARPGPAMAWPGHGPARPSVARHVAPWHGTVRLGTAWPGPGHP